MTKTEREIRRRERALARLEKRVSNATTKHGHVEILRHQAAIDRLLLSQR